MEKEEPLNEDESVDGCWVMAWWLVVGREEGMQGK